MLRIDHYLAEQTKNDGYYFEDVQELIWDGYLAERKDESYTSMKIWIQDHAERYLPKPCISTTSYLLGLFAQAQQQDAELAEHCLVQSQNVIASLDSYTGLGIAVDTALEVFHALQLFVAESIHREIASMFNDDLRVRIQIKDCQLIVKTKSLLSTHTAPESYV